MEEAKWYVVHTYSGYENKVKANIDKTIENRHLEDSILEVRVPMEDVVEMEKTIGKLKEMAESGKYSQEQLDVINDQLDAANKAGT